MVEHDVAGNRTVHGDEVDDPFGQSGLVEQLHDHVGGVDLLIGGLPHHHIAHQRS